MHVHFLFGGWLPILRILIVGTLGYACLVAILRVAGKRSLAQLSAFEFVVTVALGASFGRVLTARSVPLSEAATAFALLPLLQFAVSWLRVRSPRFAGLLRASPSLLLYRGEPLPDALRRARLTEDELRAAIRAQGIGSFAEAGTAVLEANGSISVVTSAAAGDGSALPAPEPR